MRLRLVYLLLASIVLAAGLGLRWPGLGPPWAVGKYGGSVLWAAMVYLLFRAVAPGAVGPVALAAALFAALGEATQLISVPWFDAVRGTALGHLIFGRTFALEDIAAYWIGIAVAAVVDAALRRKRKAPA